MKKVVFVLICALLSFVVYGAPSAAPAGTELLALGDNEEAVGFYLIGGRQYVMVSQGSSFYLVSATDRLGPFASAKVMLPAGYAGSRPVYATMEQDGEGKAWFVHIGETRKGPYTDIGAMAWSAEKDAVAYVATSTLDQNRVVIRLYREIGKIPKSVLKNEEFETAPETMKSHLVWDRTSSDFIWLLKTGISLNKYYRGTGGTFAQVASFSDGFLVSPVDGRLVYSVSGEKGALVYDGSRVYGPYASVAGLTLNAGNDSVSYIGMMAENERGFTAVAAPYTNGKPLDGYTAVRSSADGLFGPFFSPDGAHCLWGVSYFKLKDVNIESQIDQLEKINAGEPVNIRKLYNGAKIGFYDHTMIGPYIYLNLLWLQDGVPAWSWEENGEYFASIKGQTYGPYPGYVRLQSSYARSDAVPPFLYCTKNSGGAPVMLVHGKDKFGPFTNVLAISSSPDGKNFRFIAYRDENQKTTLVVNGKSSPLKGYPEWIAFNPVTFDPVYSIATDTGRSMVCNKIEYGTFLKNLVDYDAPHYGYVFSADGKAVSFRADRDGTANTSWIVVNGTLYTGIMRPDGLSALIQNGRKVMEISFTGENKPEGATK